MKLTTPITLAALVAGAAAAPLHIITLTPASASELQPSDSISIQPFLPQAPTAERRPCHSKHSVPGLGPLGALLSRLGISSSSPKHDHRHPTVAESRWAAITEAVEERHRQHLVMEGWMERVRQMEQEGEGAGVPIMQGGVVRMEPVSHQADEADAKEGRVHKHHAGKHAHGHGHKHRKAKSFAGRLHRALHSLTPQESVILAFVLGAGLGSILHFMLILVVLLYRQATGATSSRHEGQVRLTEETVTVEETLPAYDEESEAREVVVEKA